MSNSKRYSEGNKGSDLSYRGKVLKGLQSIADSLSTDSKGQARTPGIIRTTGSGSISFLVYDFSVSNVGAGNGTLLGQTIKAGETVNFDGGAINNYYPAGTVTYDATGTEFLIIYNS